MMHKHLALSLTFVSMFGCKRPPEAPEGLDESARFMFREFYSSDDVIGAGLTGFMDWYDDEGDTLLDATANPDNVEGFEVADLASSDLDAIDLDSYAGRDLSKANGIVSLAAMSCTPAEVEKYNLRSDQMEVFEGQFQQYDREYLSSRAVFEDTTDSGEYPSIDEDIDILSSDFDPDTTEQVLSLMTNEAVTSDAGVTVAFTLVQHWRHGIFEIQGEPTEAFLGIGFVPGPKDGETGTVMLQQYNVQAVIPRSGNMEALRLFALWLQVDSPRVPETSPSRSTTSVNKAKQTAERLNEICNGEVDLPAE